MKIVVRHEGASAQEVEQTCVWIVGDDGETIGTEYLKPGQQVDVDVSGSAAIDASFCEPGPIGAPDVPADEPPAPEDPPAPGDQSASTSGDGGTSDGGGDTPGAPGVASGGAAGGEVAE